MLNASKSDAVFTRDGKVWLAYTTILNLALKVSTIPESQLFESAETVTLMPGYNLEGYPNRDSNKYKGG